MIRAGLVTGVVLVTFGVAACGPEEDHVDSTDETNATTRLEQQREDVRGATADLQRYAAETLAGTVTGSSGQWRGCESGGLEEYRNFRYLADARIDVPADTARPYLELLGDAFEQAGFSAGEARERPGGRTLVATRADVTASFSELPEQGDHVLLSVAGPCIDVPEDERDDWLVRDEPTPEIR